jgi:uncharacterized protein YcbX
LIKGDIAEAANPFFSHTLPVQSVTSTVAQESPRTQLQPNSDQIVAMKVYPIKGCGPLRVRKWPLDAGTDAFFLDRRWCLAVATGGKRARPLSAKQAPRLTQVRISLRLNASRGRACLVLSTKNDTVRPLLLPLAHSDAAVIFSSGAAESEELAVTEAVGAGVAAADWDDDDCMFDRASILDRAARWFEALLNLPRLQFLEAGSSAGTGEPPSGSAHFANAPQTLLMVSTASLAEFGRLCGLAVPADRFRANLEVSFGTPFLEAGWPLGHSIHFCQTAATADSCAKNDVHFETAGRCVRCQAVDIDPDDGAATGQSLLAALATMQAGEGSGAKGPTFGVLLRSCCSHTSLHEHRVLCVGMHLHAASDAASKQDSAALRHLFP